MAARQVRRSVVMSNLRVGLLAMDSDQTPLGKGKDVLHGATRAAPLRQSVEQPCRVTEPRSSGRVHQHRRSPKPPRTTPQKTIRPGTHNRHVAKSAVEVRYRTNLDLLEVLGREMRKFDPEPTSYYLQIR